VGGETGGRWAMASLHTPNFSKHVLRPDRKSEMSLGIGDSRKARFLGSKGKTSGSERDQTETISRLAAHLK